MLKKVNISLRAIILFLVCIGVAFGSGYYVHGVLTDKTEVVKNENQDNDLKLPGEVEKCVVTKEEVHSKLVEIKEFSTYSGEYNVTKAADYSRYFLSDENKKDSGIKIPGTTNSVDITCDGIVKVGYDFDEIVINVDNDSYKVYISLPEAKITDNYIIWDTVVCKENNNILNPIDFAQYEALIDDLEDMGLKDVESKGIYGSAEESIKKIITNTLSKFEEFEIVFM